MIRKRELSPFVRESVDNLMTAIALGQSLPGGPGAPNSAGAIQLLYRGMMKSARKRVYPRNKFKIPIWTKIILRVISNMTGHGF